MRNQHLEWLTAYSESGTLKPKDFLFDYGVAMLLQSLYPGEIDAVIREHLSSDQARTASRMVRTALHRSAPYRTTQKNGVPCSEILNELKGLFPPTP